MHIWEYCKSKETEYGNHNPTKNFMKISIFRFELSVKQKDGLTTSSKREENWRIVRKEKKRERFFALWVVFQFKVQTCKLLFLHEYIYIGLFCKCHPIFFTIQNTINFDQNHPKMRRGYESEETDFASAVAASAHAIHSLAEISSKAQIARANTTKHEPLRPLQGGIYLTFLLLYFFYYFWRCVNVKILV